MKRTAFVVVLNTSKTADFSRRMRHDVFGITKFNKPTSALTTFGRQSVKDVGYITNFMILAAIIILMPGAVTALLISSSVDVSVGGVPASWTGSVSGDIITFDPAKGELAATFEFTRGALNGSMKIARQFDSTIIKEESISIDLSSTNLKKTFTWNGKTIGGSNAPDDEYYMYVYVSNDVDVAPIVSEEKQIHIKLQRSQPLVSTPAPPPATTTTNTTAATSECTNGNAKCEKKVDIAYRPPYELKKCIGGIWVVQDTFTYYNGYEGSCKEACYNTYYSKCETPSTLGMDYGASSVSGTTGTSGTTTVDYPSCSNQCVQTYGTTSNGKCMNAKDNPSCSSPSYVPLHGDQASIGKNYGCDSDKICCCKSPKSECQVACEQRGATGSCVPIDQYSPSVKSDLEKCLVCVSRENKYCADQTRKGCSVTQCTRTLITTNECRNTYNPGYFPVINIPAAAADNVFMLSQQGLCEQGQECWCAKTPFGSQNAFATVLSKSCVISGNQRIASALILWDGTAAKYATVQFGAPYAYVPLGSGFLSGILTGGCNDYGTSPYAIGSYDVPEKQGVLYGLEHMIPCTTRLYGTGTQVTGWVTLYNEYKITIATIPFDMDCELAPTSGVSEPVTPPAPRGTYAAAEIQETNSRGNIKCNSDIDYAWSLIDMDYGTGLETSGSGSCEIAFKKDQSFNAVELMADKDATIKKIMVDSKEIKVGKEAAANVLFRHDFASTKGRTFRVEYEASSGGRIKFSEIDPMPEKIIIETDVLPQVTIKDNPIIITGKVSKKSNRDGGYRGICESTFLTGYPYGCSAITRWGVKVRSECAGGPPEYVLKESKCNFQADLSLELLETIGDLYDVYVQIYGGAEGKTTNYRCVVAHKGTLDEKFFLEKRIGDGSYSAVAGYGSDEPVCIQACKHAETRESSSYCLTTEHAVKVDYVPGNAEPSEEPTKYRCSAFDGKFDLEVQTSGLFWERQNYNYNTWEECVGICIGLANPEELCLSKGQPEPATGAVTGKGITDYLVVPGNAITGRAVDPTTAKIVVAAVIKLTNSIKLKQEAARLGQCSYAREFPSQCVQSASCPKNDPKYPGPAISYEAYEKNPNVGYMRVVVPKEFDECNYFAPTRPAEPYATTVTVSLYTGRAVEGAPVWTQPVETDENGAFTHEITAPEPGNYTIFLEAHGSYGSATAGIEVISVEDTVVVASPPSQCGKNNKLYTASVGTPADATGVGSLVRYDLTIEKPAGMEADFDAGFVLPTGELADSYILNVPLGQQGSVMISVLPKHELADGNYQFKVKADSIVHDVHKYAVLDYYYTERIEPSVSIDESGATPLPAGSKQNFPVSIKNNDPSQCGSDVFYISKIVPAGWSNTLKIGGDVVEENVEIFPQSSASGIFTVQSAQKSKGNYNITLAVSRGSPADFLTVAAKSIAIDGSILYLTSSSKIMSSLSGGPAEVVYEASSPAGVAFDISAVYWSDTSTAAGVYSIPKTGGSVSQVAAAQAQQMAADGSYVYFASQNSIKKVLKSAANEDCNGDKCVLHGGLGTVNDIAAADSVLYWVEDNGKIRSSGTSGDSINERLTDANIQAIAVSGGEVFYTARSPERIVKCDIFFNECRTVSTWVNQKDDISDIAIDRENLYWSEGGKIKTISRDAVTTYSSAVFRIAPPPAPVVSIKPSVQTGPAGQEKIFYVNITNSAQAGFIMNLTAECPAEWTCEISRSVSVPAGVGKSKIAEMKVTPAAGVAQGDYSIYLNATGEYWPNIMRTSAKHKVGEHIAPRVEITPASQTGYPGRELSYNANIMNRDDSSYGPSQINITVGPPLDWPYSISESMITLNGQESRNLTLKITSKKDSADLMSYEFSVSASIYAQTGTGTAFYEVKACGDGICSTELGETYSSCQKDCWDGPAPRFKCANQNSKGLYECDKSATSGVEFSSDVTQEGGSPVFVACARGSSQSACISAFGSNNCGTGKACLCGSSSSKCSIVCGDDIKDYYMLYKTRVASSIFASSDLITASPNYTYSCPYFGLDELRSIAANWTYRKSMLEQAGDDALDNFNDKNCYDANRLAAQKAGEFIAYLNKAIASPTLENTAAARRNNTELQQTVERIVSTGCLGYYCGDINCDDSNPDTIDIARVPDCQCQHLSQCPFACAAKCEDTTAAPCYKVIKNYGKTGCGDSYCCDRIEVACPSAPPGGDCPQGQVRNATTGLCQSKPLCNPGYSYNTTSGKCQQDISVVCPSNSYYNTTLKMCVGKISCPDDFTFNTSSQKCEGPPQNTIPPSCEDGFTYIAARNICLGEPTCESGFFYNNTAKKCTQIPECSYGNEWNQTSKRCEGPAGCASGTLNPKTGNCENPPLSPSDCRINLSSTCRNYNLTMNVVWSGGYYARAEIDGKQSGTLQSKSFSYSDYIGRNGSVSTRVFVFDSDDNLKCSGNVTAACRPSTSCGYGEIFNLWSNRCEPCPAGTVYEPAAGECVAAEETGWAVYIAIIIFIPVLVLVMLYFRDDIRKQLKRFNIWLHYKF